DLSPPGPGPLLRPTLWDARCWKASLRADTVTTGRPLLQAVPAHQHEHPDEPQPGTDAPGSTDRQATLRPTRGGRPCPRRPRRRGDGGLPAAGGSGWIQPPAPPRRPARRARPRAPEL